MGEEKYTQKTLTALQAAQQAAALHYHQVIRTQIIFMEHQAAEQQMLDLLMANGMILKA